MFRLEHNVLLIIFLLAFATSFGQTQELDSLKKLLHKSDKDNINYLLAMGNYYTEESVQNVDSIQHYGNLVIGIVDKLKDSEQKIDAEYLLGLAETYAKNYDNAIQLMEKVIKKSQKIGYYKGERKANTAIAEIYNRKGESAKGIKYYENAYDLAEKHQEPENIVLDLMVNLCHEYFQISDYSKVSALLEKAVLTIDKPSVPAETRCLFYLNAASINMELDKNNLKKSVEQFSIALEIAEKSNNGRFQIGALINLSILHGGLYKVDYNKAIFYSQKAIDVIQGNTILAGHYGTALFYLGKYYYFNKNYDKAVETLENATKEYEKNQGFNYTEALAFLGYAYQKKNQTKASKITFNKALSEFYNHIEYIKKNGNSKNDLSWSYRRIAEIDSAQGNFEKSLVNYKLHVAYQDSINRETNIKITERLDFVKKTAEQDKKITRLTSQNNIQSLKAKQQTIIGLALLIGVILLAILLAVVYNRFRLKKKALHIIKEKNQENELLMGEIHHRVKNNLQIILSLLSAQKDSHIDNEALKTALTESQNKIQSMAIIHQNLYKGNNFSSVAVDSYLYELIRNIRASFGSNNHEVDFELNIDTTEIKMGLAVPLGLILNELITNCYKYAFVGSEKKTKKVDISFKSLEGPHKFQLILKDNGIGLPKNFSVEDNPSFGIQLVHGLVEQLNGKIVMDIEEGTRFEIYLEEPIAA